MTSTSFIRMVFIVSVSFGLAVKCYAQGDSLFVFNIDSCMANDPVDYGQDASAYGYDFLKMAAVLQGIVNRDSTGNKIFYIYQNSVNPPFNADVFWLNYLSQPGKYLSNYKKIWVYPSVDSFYTDLLPHFKDVVKGLVLWTDSIPATSNVASTICGVDDYLPAQERGQLDSDLVRYLGQLPVINLAAQFSETYTTIPGTNIPTTGSKKCDLYLWAMDKCINTGEVNPTCVEYYVDAYSTLKSLSGQVIYSNLFNRGLINADYGVANRGFFVDLDPDSSVPNDDPTQPPGADYHTFKEILAALRAQADTSIITVHGFVPWPFKYTNGTTANAVAQEWNSVNLFSSYYAQVDADAPGYTGLANASIYEHVPLDQNLKQNNDQGENGEVYSRDSDYVCFYMGDYDSGAWTSNRLPALWNSSGRGAIPLAWGIDPGLSMRIPQAFDYYYETAGKNDYFVSGDNGAGYLNSIALPTQFIPYWSDYQQRLFKEFDLSIAGFVITGFSGNLPIALESDYTKFAPNGVGVNTQGQKSIVNGVPFAPVHDLSPSSPTTATQVEQGILKLLPGVGSGYVLFIRTILTNPSVLASGVALLNQNYPSLHVKVVDPYTAFRFLEPVTGVLNSNGVGAIPKSFEMSQNYPNPFNPSTTISYDIPEKSHVKIVVYNVLGQAVATLVNGDQQGGEYSVSWNASRVSSGVYIASIRADDLDNSRDFAMTRKMLYLK